MSRWNAYCHEVTLMMKLLTTCVIQLMTQNRVSDTIMHVTLYAMKQCSLEGEKKLIYMQMSVIIESKKKTKIGIPLHFL